MLVTEIASYVLTILIPFTVFPTLASASCTYPGSPFQKFNERGAIESPGYPTQYYGGETCDWYLNPPRGTVPGLLVMDIIFDTNIDGVPVTGDVCKRAKNYINIGRARACGKEGPVCIALMPLSTRDLNCHRMIAKDFPQCSAVLVDGWPLQVTFQTEKPDNKLGFQLNYTFVECNADIDEKKDTTQASTIITTDPIESENTTELNDTTPTMTTKDTTTITTTTISTTTRTLATNPKTERTNPPKTTTMKSKHETMEPAPQNTNLILTIVLVLLCAILIIITVAVIFRKKLRAWVNDKPATTNGSTNGSGVNYTDAYIIPINKDHTYEQPLPTYPPPIPPPYRSPSTSTDNSNSTGYDGLNSTASANANGSEPGAGIIQDYVYDTIQI